MARLYSLCWLNDGCHWLLISAAGFILAVSEAGFPTEEDALLDLGARVQV
jgi:hypothetical protein